MKRTIKREGSLPNVLIQFVEEIQSYELTQDKCNLNLSYYKLSLN